MHRTDTLELPHLRGAAKIYLVPDTIETTHAARATHVIIRGTKPRLEQPIPRTPCLLVGTMTGRHPTRRKGTGKVPD